MSIDGGDGEDGVARDRRPATSYPSPTGTCRHRAWTAWADDARGPVEAPAIRLIQFNEPGRPVGQGTIPVQEPPAPMSFPIHRFEEFGALTVAERRAVAALGEAPRDHGRNRLIRGEGAEATGFYLLLDGWAASWITLPDGGRQIMKLHLPGDAMGTPSMSLAYAAETLTAITPAVTSAVPFERFGKLLIEQPRVAAFFLLSVQRERVALMDRLAAIGRTGAEARLAALLADLLDRLTALGAVEAGGFAMPLTQEQIGDTLGLTAVHVNRMLRGLEDRGLIARGRGRLTVRDPAALARLAGLPHRALRTDLGWLPPPG